MASPDQRPGSAHRRGDALLDPPGDELIDGFHRTTRPPPEAGTRPAPAARGLRTIGGDTETGLLPMAVVRPIRRPKAVVGSRRYAVHRVRGADRSARRSRPREWPRARALRRPRAPAASAPPSCRSCAMSRMNFSYDALRPPSSQPTAWTTMLTGDGPARHHSDICVSRSPAGSTVRWTRIVRRMAQVGGMSGARPTSFGHRGSRRTTGRDAREVAEVTRR